MPMSLSEALAECEAATLAQAQSLPAVSARWCIGLLMLMEVGLWISQSVFFRSLGMRLFQFAPERAEIVRPVMSMQGLSNLFLAFALLIGIVDRERAGFVEYGLLCISVAGICGALALKRSIFILQAVSGVAVFVFYAWANPSLCVFFDV